MTKQKIAAPVNRAFRNVEAIRRGFEPLQKSLLRDNFERHKLESASASSAPAADSRCATSRQQPSRVLTARRDVRSPSVMTCNVPHLAYLLC